MTNLLMRATNIPAPIGSIMVGIIKETENYCGDGSVVTGVTVSHRSKVGKETFVYPI